MKPVPEQKFGGHSDNEFREECTTRQDAIRLYEVACKNLLAVNDWEKICKNLLSADFTLCDTSGRPVIRLPKEKDYIKIDIPGPGPKKGDGFDWVSIEELGNYSDPDNDMDLTYIKVRPSDSPETNTKHTAHFLSPEANSTFLVKRLGEAVIGEIHGRNEVPNTSTESEIDNVRNTMVAKLAMTTFSDVQWKVLSKAFITYSNSIKP